jgi:hypothetical protein
MTKAAVRMPVQHYSEYGRQIGRTVPRGRCRWFARSLLRNLIHSSTTSAWPSSAARGPPARNARSIASFPYRRSKQPLRDWQSETGAPTGPGSGPSIARETRAGSREDFPDIRSPAQCCLRPWLRSNGSGRSCVSKGLEQRLLPPIAFDLIEHGDIQHRPQGAASWQHNRIAIAAEAGIDDTDRG